ncbi:MAG: hypothetical protein IPH48_16980 [bacterium]|nr:hypothetical protein [bacterium]
MAVEIHDARGRTVRRLSGLATAGRAELVWDGRDGNGRTVASGTYFARTGGARPAATRLTLVKMKMKYVTDLWRVCDILSGAWRRAPVPRRLSLTSPGVRPPGDAAPMKAVTNRWRATKALPVWLGPALWGLPRSASSPVPRPGAKVCPPDAAARSRARCAHSARERPPAPADQPRLRGHARRRARTRRTRRGHVPGPRQPFRGRPSRTHLHQLGRGRLRHHRRGAARRQRAHHLTAPDPARAPACVTSGHDRAPARVHPRLRRHPGVRASRWVPVFDGDTFLGLFGGVYSYEELLAWPWGRSARATW